MAHRVQIRARAAQHFVYSGRTVLVMTGEGWVPGADPFGLYVDNTRLLSRLELTVGGRAPDSIAVSPVGGDASLAYSEVPAGEGIPARSVFVETRRFVGDGMRQVLRLRSYAREQVRLALGLHLAADFADSEEAERHEHRVRAEAAGEWDASRHELVFRARHPGLDRAVAISVESSPGEPRWEAGALKVDVELEPGGAAELGVSVEPIFEGRRVACTSRRSFAETGDDLARLRSRIADELPVLTSTNATVTRAWQTAVRDLASLPYGLPDGPATPIAGLPLYLQFFGRDSLTIGWQAVMATPTLMRDALVANAAWRGRRIDDWLDEEPGKMIHQARNGPLSALGMNPFSRYYGDWATPPDFLVMLGQYLAWTGDMDTVRGLLPAARDAADWCERYGDLDRDGFLEYHARSPGGVKNQGWKDSDEAIVDEAGNVVPNPIATSELQAYWYAGLRQAAWAFAAAGDLGYAADLLARSNELRSRFNERFWMPGRDAYALGLDREKRQIRSIGSNDGHLLAAGIVPPERGRTLAARLMAADMFSGWGIRTLSADHPAFNPFSYHLGSVWPVEQGTIAFGFARYGCWDELHRLTAGVFDLTDLFIENRLPEVVGGIRRDAEHPHPGIYPDSCEPQGWSASAVVMLVQSLLAMVAVAPIGLLVVDPHLPPWLPDLRLEGVRVGRARLDLEFRRKGEATDYRVVRRDGRVRVLRQPPPQSPAAGLVGRARAAVGSVVRS